MRSDTLRPVPTGTWGYANAASDNGIESKEPLTVCVHAAQGDSGFFVGPTTGDYVRLEISSYWASYVYCF